MSSQKNRSRGSGSDRQSTSVLHPFSAATTLVSPGESSHNMPEGMKANSRILPAELPPAYRKRMEAAGQAINAAFTDMADGMQKMWQDQRQYIIQEVSTLQRLLREQHQSHSKEMALMRYELDSQRRYARKLAELEQELKLLKAGGSRIKEVFAAATASLKVGYPGLGRRQQRRGCIFRALPCLEARYLCEGARHVFLWIVWSDNMQETQCR